MVPKISTRCSSTWPDQRQGHEGTLGPSIPSRSNNSVAAFHVLFPDRVKRAPKRRLFSCSFLRLLHDTTQGHLIAKTDVPAYADFVETQLNNFNGFELKGVNSADQILSAVPKSHREKKCRQYTIPVYSYRFEKRSNQVGDEEPFQC